MWDGIASSYDRKFEKEYCPIFKRLSQQLNMNDQVLEIGCGSGLVSFEAAKYCSFVTGIDLSESMIAIAQEKKERFRIDNIKFLVGNAENLPKQMDIFDKIILCNCLHVVDSPSAVLEEAKRNMADKSKLLLFTYCHKEKLKPRQFLFSFGMRFLHRIGCIPAMHSFSFLDVKELCERVGLISLHEELFSAGGFPCAFFILQNHSSQTR